MKRVLGPVSIMFRNRRSSVLNQFSIHIISISPTVPWEH